MEDNEYEILFNRNNVIKKGHMLLSCSDHCGIEFLFNDGGSIPHYYTFLNMLSFNKNSISLQLDEDIDINPAIIFIENMKLNIKILRWPKIKPNIAADYKYNAIYDLLGYYHAYYGFSVWKDEMNITDDIVQSCQFLWDYLRI